jgi:two-component system chemotaxis sensor kinase CheA
VDVIQKLAEKLGKKVQPLEINDHGCFLPAEELNEIFASYVHVFRNSMDHGIENPEERLALGKAESGNISVDLKVIHRESGHELEILVKDDGRGISTDTLRGKLISRYPEKRSYFEKLSEHELIQHIFDDDISTRDQVTDLSGRGVGLSALKFSIESRGGTILAETKAGQGTQILARIPFQLELRVISTSAKKAA